LQISIEPWKLILDVTQALISSSNCEKISNGWGFAPGPTDGAHISERSFPLLLKEEGKRQGPGRQKKREDRETGKKRREEERMCPYKPLPQNPGCIHASF
jgi:hypothetical protein